ncbi:TPA: DegT/DnrJ/EryC1/StrS family aminotransferase, partial [Candidatus Poribacteria bacterium]|nr:DegT/DnrJ/EryC1/StrS family aminotransferase [Candidatus Poribacteria bacterium]
MAMLRTFNEKFHRLITLKREDESLIKFAGRVHRRLRLRRLLKKEVGKEELKQLKSVIRSGNLFHGPKVEQFRDEFAKLYGVRYAITSTSGTAAIHVALAMLNPEPGDEIIVPPLTDMGTIIPIIYQNAIPIFADIHPETWTIDPESLERAITPKTKGIIVVHLLGGVCDMDAILDVAQRHNLPVIEDCAQANLAEYKHRLVGTIGDIGCFSFQQTKHMITGDGGMTITNSSEYGNRGLLFVDKGWNRSAWGTARQYTMLGMNYRMTELQAAVGIAQLRKLRSITERRNRNGKLMAELLMKIDGITPQYIGEGDKHTYWYYGFTVNPDAPFTAEALARTLSEQDVLTTAHYIGKPIFLCSEPLMKKQLYGNSHFPFDYPNARQDITYEPGMCPVAEDVLNRLVLLHITERYSEKDVKNIANEISQAVSKLSRNIKGQKGKRANHQSSIIN